MVSSTKKLMAALIATTALTGAAHAADLPEPVMAAGDWTGFHIGIGGGYGGVNHRLAVNADIFGGTFDDALSLDGLGGEGGLFTVEGGYDYQFGSDFVIGILGDYTYSGIGTELKFDGFGYELDASHSYSVLGRMGWVSSPDTLIYGLVGWTWTKFEGDFSDGGPDYDFKLNGVTLGAGIETRFTPNITGKLEYRYVDYGDNTLFEDNFLDDSFVELYNDSSLQTIRAVVSYNFGNPGGYVEPAADLSVAEVANWTGLRIGAGGGYGFVNHELSLLIEDDNLASLSGFTGEGGLLTAEIGYDYQFSNDFVAGIQFDYTRGWVETVAELDLDVDGFTGYRLQATNNYTVAGRLGYLANPETLVYGLVGWTWTDFDQDLKFLGENIFTDFVDDFKADGLTVGAGIETILAENITGKLEYRYTNYETLNVFDSDEFDVDGDAVLNNDPSLQSIRAVVSYKLPLFN